MNQLSEPILLPCPFCGEKAAINYVEDEAFKIGCNLSNCVGSFCNQATYPSFQMPARIRQWNFRPSLTVSVILEGEEGPASVFDELRLAMAYVRATGKAANVWFMSGSSIMNEVAKNT